MVRAGRPFLRQLLWALAVLMLILPAFTLLTKHVIPVSAQYRRTFVLILHESYERSLSLTVAVVGRCVRLGTSGRILQAEPPSSVRLFWGSCQEAFEWRPAESNDPQLGAWLQTHVDPDHQRLLAYSDELQRFVLEAGAGKTKPPLSPFVVMPNFFVFSDHRREWNDTAFFVGLIVWFVGARHIWRSSRRPLIRRTNDS